MKGEKNNERSHFVISTNALYGLILSMFLGGAGTFGTLEGKLFSEGSAGQCPDHSSMALSLAERNGRDVADIRDAVRDMRSFYRAESVAKEYEKRQTERDGQQDRRTHLIEREFDIILGRHNAEVQQD